MDAHQFTLMLRTAYFSVRRKTNSVCSPFQCNGDQFVMLCVLAEKEGVTQQDLVHEAGYDPATTGSMLRQLEQRELVRREAHPEDGRAKWVTLTLKGKEVYEQLWDVTLPVRLKFWNRLTSEQRQTVFDGLEVIVNCMNENGE